MAALEHERLSLVFGDRPDIVKGIQEAADTPERVTLFNSIADFISTKYVPSSTSEPSAKRRRLSNDNGEDCGMMASSTAPKPAAGAQQTPGTERLLIDLANQAAEEVVLLEVKEISVSIPQRKKYDLVFTKNFLYTKVVNTSTPVQGMVFKWSEIEYVFVAPIPEKQQLLYNYVLFPKDVALSSTKSWPPVSHEPFLFTVPVTAPKAGIVSGYAFAHAGAALDSYPDLMNWALTSQLGATGNATEIVKTNPQVFHSALRQPHRPNEKAVHVKAHRGSKDGFLFFLPTGILWGFKKPLLFIPLDRILALSYTNILQRTFNIEIEIDVSHAPHEAAGQKAHGGQQLREDGAGDREGKTEVIEFAMIDQEDYQTIEDKYVRRHGLNNRSLAEGKRARRQLKENGVKGERGANGTAAADDAGDPQDAELDRVEQILEEDEEDEEEEDYDPGSEGESEGEGSSSEDESGEEGEEGDDDEEEDGEEGEEEDAEHEGAMDEH